MPKVLFPEVPLVVIARMLGKRPDCPSKSFSVFMALGHAAGLAAAQAIEEDVAVQAIDVPTLQQRLADEGQVMTLE